MRCSPEEEEEKGDDDDDCIILETNPCKETSQEEDDDCIILVTNPFKKTSGDDDDCVILDHEVTDGIFNLFKKLSSQQLQDEDVSIVAETGQVACRDYPHSRYHCAQYPFNLAPHESCCDQCYCFVCETKAPCQYWKNPAGQHCDASELESEWRRKKDLKRFCRELLSE